MNQSFDPARLDSLVQDLLDGRLPAEDAAELRGILRSSADARRRYRHSAAVHCALLRQAPQIAPDAVSVRRLPRRQIIVLASAAAACLLVVLGLMRSRPEAAVATLAGSSSASWEHSAPGDGQALETGRSWHLLRGFAEIHYLSGVEILLEGPARFEISGPAELRISHGRASVKIPPDVERFQLDTPGGPLRELGREFGVAVGSGSEGAVVLTDVFEKSHDPATPPPSEPARESFALVRDAAGTRHLSTLSGYRIDLRDTVRELPRLSFRRDTGDNLALGKPVFSPAYYSKPHGSRFPPETLTDGRLNDSGTPGDWSFWLAPNGESGQFTVDLLEPTRIGRIELQNTRNRTYGDRGLHGFIALVSDDNQIFREILAGELAAISPPPAPGEDFPFETFLFEPVTARYLKIIGTSHHRHPARPEADPDHGGGLNEIRIFAP
jgi:hypothetical protein